MEDITAIKSFKEVKVIVIVSKNQKLKTVV